MSEPLAASAASVWCVVGASGFVGGAIVERLRSQGRVVREVPAPRLRSDATNALAAVLDAFHETGPEAELASAFAGADVVVNAAGLASPDSPLTPELVGANAVLPLVVARAARAAGARRVVHLGSAAVQGRTRLLTESRRTTPFSPYSTTKAWGETALESVPDARGRFEVVTVRATSVQGPARPTTESLRRVARSRLASVAGDGSAPTCVTSVTSLAELVEFVGTTDEAVPPIVLQPWEGLTTASVLEAAGGRRPCRVPRALATIGIRTGLAVSALLGGRFAGALRRVELMWFGQAQVEGWAVEHGFVPGRRVAGMLAERRPTVGVLSQWFDPEPGPAALPGVLAREFVALGFDVRVLTGFPNYPTGVLADGYRQRPRTVTSEGGVTVTRVPLIVSHSASATGRILNYLSFALSATAFGRGALRGCDAVWVYNSPATVALPLLVHTRLGRLPYFLHVQDLWPESLVESGLLPAGRSGRFAARLVCLAVGVTERRARRVGVISRGAEGVIRARNPRLGRTSVDYVPNPTDEAVFVPVAAPRRAPDEPLTLLYVGAVGEVQGLDTLLRAVAQVDATVGVRLRIVGDGIALERLRRLAAELGTDSVSFDGRVTKERAQLLLGEGDVHVVSLASKPFLRHTTPSKIASLLSSGVPILGIVDGDGADLLRASGAALVVAPGDVAALSAALVELARTTSDARAALGAAGRRFYLDHLSARRAATDILAALLPGTTTDSAIRKGTR